MVVFRRCLAPDCHNFHANDKYCSRPCQYAARTKHRYCICETCHTQFPLVSNPGNRPHRFCSTNCRIAAQKAKLLRQRTLTDVEIREAGQMYTNGATVKDIAKHFQTNATNIYRFLKEVGVKWRSPTGNPGKRAPRPPRFTPTEIEEIKFLYGFGYSALHIAGTMGMKDKSAILRVLNDLGMTRRGFDPAKRIRTQDGHFVRSAAELLVDDWLYTHDIAHIYEPKLTVDPHYHADFFARGFYIELWGGGPNRKAYTATMKKKLALYEAHQIPLLSLTWEDTLKNLDAKLAPVLMPRD